jgi:hypothetical protein
MCYCIESFFCVCPTRQLYGIESLHVPGHLLTAAVFGTTIKETHCMRSENCYPHCIRTVYVCVVGGPVLQPLKQWMEGTTREIRSEIFLE